MSDVALHRRIDFDERVPLNLSGVEHKGQRRGYPGPRGLRSIRRWLRDDEEARRPFALILAEGRQRCEKSGEKEETSWSQAGPHNYWQAFIPDSQKRMLLFAASTFLPSEISLLYSAIASL